MNDETGLGFHFHIHSITVSFYTSGAWAGLKNITANIWLILPVIIVDFRLCREFWERGKVILGWKPNTAGQMRGSYRFKVSFSLLPVGIKVETLQIYLYHTQGPLYQVFYSSKTKSGKVLCALKLFSGDSFR